MALGAIFFAFQLAKILGGENFGQKVLLPQIWVVFQAYFD